MKLFYIHIHKYTLKNALQNYFLGVSGVMETATTRQVNNMEDIFTFNLTPWKLCPSTLTACKHQASLM